MTSERNPFLDADGKVRAVPADLLLGHVVEMGDGIVDCGVLRLDDSIDGPSTVEEAIDFSDSLDALYGEFSRAISAPH